MNSQLDCEDNFTIPKRCFPKKLLIGPGPTNPSPRVINAMTTSAMTPNSPEFHEMVDDIQIMLRYVFQTKNEVTLALQASGTGGVEAAVCNTVDPGETVVVAVSGVWGQRTVEIAKTRNANVVRLESTPGEIFTIEELEKEIKNSKPVALFVTHGESSGGTVQNLEGLGKMCHKYDCLLVVDAVVSLGAVPFYTDRWEIDVAVSASQKGIGAPPGMSLITMSPKAVDRMKCLKCPPPFYYNIVGTCQQWNIFQVKRCYYITYSSHMLSALRESLLEIKEEGLLKRWERHRVCAERFWAESQKLGMKMLVDKDENRLLNVTCYFPPAGIVNLDIIKFLFEKYQVEPGFGLTSFTNNALRIGFMGYNARIEVVDYTLKVLGEAIAYCKSSN